MQNDPALIHRWRSVAQCWEKNRDTIVQLFSPVTEALVQDAGIVAGSAVLDAGTGPGEPALRIASLVGPQGKVAGIDPAPEMLEAARRAAHQMGAANTQFEIAYADKLPFADQTFDAVVSRFGSMFFPSPVDAVREFLRVLKPGGKLALAVWGEPDRNSFFFVLSRVIDRYVQPPPFDPDALDAFRFAAPGKLRDILAEAGVRSPSERLLRCDMRAPVSVEDFWTLRCEMSEKYREKLAQLSSEQLAEVKRQTIEGLREYSSESGMSFPTEVLVVSGTK